MNFGKYVLSAVKRKSLIGVAIAGSIGVYYLYNTITSRVQLEPEPEPEPVMQDENSPLNTAFTEEDDDDLSTIPDDMTDVSLEHECYKNALYNDVDPYGDICPMCWLTQPRTYNCECVNYSKSTCSGCDPYCRYCGGRITFMVKLKALARRYIPPILRGITIGLITYFMYLDLQPTIRTITIGDTRYITNGATHIVIRTYNN